MKFTNVLVFIGGVGIGAVGSGLYFKKKYEEEARIACEETREYYRYLMSRKEPTPIEEVMPEPEFEPHEQEMEEYIEFLEEKTDYTAFAKKGKDFVESKKPYVKATKAPYAIHPEDFANHCMLYDKITLHYISKADEVVNELEEPFDDWETIIGVDNIRNEFGKWESGVLYVRNDELECDYEIISDTRDLYEEEE